MITIDITLVIHIINMVVLMVVLNAILYKPVQAILLKRQEKLESLGKDVEQSHGKPKLSLKVFPHFVTGVLEITNVSEHGENGLNDHAHVPFPSLAGPQVGGIPIFLFKAGV